MEIEPNGNVVQKSKEYNRTEEDYEEAEIFLKKWKKNVLKKIQKQEKVPKNHRLHCGLQNFLLLIRIMW